MTLIELNKIAKEGDRVKRPNESIDAAIYFPFDEGYCLTMKDILADDWELIPKAKECWVNVYESPYLGEMEIGTQRKTIEEAKTKSGGSDYRGTIHITYDPWGKLKVEVVE